MLAPLENPSARTRVRIAAGRTATAELTKSASSSARLAEIGEVELADGETAKKRGDAVARGPGRVGRAAQRLGASARPRPIEIVLVATGAV